ncbi:MAG: dTMP kinase [Deltaproteobacteria bacterium]|nr:dTMP kinase [Deltaproteobacteria bacterium]
MFITFEGIEGCGKTTQMKLLREFFAEVDVPCLLTREPGGTAVGEEIRKIFLHSDNTELLASTELLLVTAARVQHINMVIRPALAQGKVVVCDRFFDATAAYQGSAGGVEPAMIEKAHAIFCDSFLPDLTILFDCPVEIGLGRSRSRNRDEGIEKMEGRFEDKDICFHEKVRAGYLERADREPGRFVLVDTRQSVEAVHQQVVQVVREGLGKVGYVV